MIHSVKSFFQVNKCATVIITIIDSLILSVRLISACAVECFLRNPKWRECITLLISRNSLKNFRGLRPLYPHQGSALDLLRDSKRLPQIHSCREVIARCASSTTFIPHVIYKQQTQGKTYQFWWENSGKKEWKSSKTQGKWCWKFCTNPVLPYVLNFRQ